MVHATFTGHSSIRWKSCARERTDDNDSRHAPAGEDLSCYGFLPTPPQAEKIVERIAVDPQRQTPSDSAPPAHPENWPVAIRIGFRITFAYLALYLFPFPLDYFGVNVPDPWEKVVPWLGRHLFHLEITTRYGGGDTLYGYAGNIFLLTLAAVIAVIWSLLDRKAAHYDPPHCWLRLWVRAYRLTKILSEARKLATP